MKLSIFVVFVKCADVGAAKFLKKRTCAVRECVRSEKPLCVECAGVPKLAAHKDSDANSINIF